MSLLIFLVCSFLLLGTVARPKTFIYVVFFLGPLPFGALLRNPAVSTPVGLIHINALLVFAMLLASLAGVLLYAPRVRRQLSSCWLYLLFLAYAGVSMTWAPDISMSLRMMLKLVTPVVFMLYVAATVERLGAPVVMRAVVASGAFYAFASLVSWGLAIAPGGGFGLPATSAAVTSGHLLSTFAVVVAEWLAAPSLLRAAISLLVGLAILAGFTRITIAGMFAEASIGLFFRARGFAKVALPALGILAFVALFTFVGEFRSRMFLEKASSISFSSIIRDPSGTIGAIGGSGRYAAWDLALSTLYKPYPIAGSGIGATQLLFYDPTGVGTSAVHSEPIRLLCDLGIVGLTLFVLAWVQLFRLLINHHRVSHLYGSPTVALASLAAAGGYLVFLLTDNGLDYVAQMGVFTYGLVGAVLGVRSERRARDYREMASMLATGGRASR